MELDQFNLTLSGEIVTPFSEQGHVGLTASSNEVDFDAVQYTVGWDEYDEHISGWQKKTGDWLVSEDGLTQLDTSVARAATFKGDRFGNYEFSTYFRNDRLPDKGEVGYYPLYVDDDNFVKVFVDYVAKTVTIGAKRRENQLTSSFFLFKRRC
jgi:hypothetical protein